MKYIIIQDQPMFVREFYEVEADDEEEAKDSFYTGDYKYLGHNLRDNISFLDNTLVGVEQREDLPEINNLA